MFQTFSRNDLPGEAALSRGRSVFKKKKEKRKKKGKKKKKRKKKRKEKKKKREKGKKVFAGVNLDPPGCEVSLPWLRVDVRFSESANSCTLCRIIDIADILGSRS